MIPTKLNRLKMIIAAKRFGLQTNVLFLLFFVYIIININIIDIKYITTQSATNNPSNSL